MLPEDVGRSIESVTTECLFLCQVARRLGSEERSGEVDHEQAPGEADEAEAHDTEGGRGEGSSHL